MTKKIPICITISETSSKKAAESAKNFDFAEIRMDIIQDININWIDSVFSHKNKLIATFRGSPETENNRLHLLLRAMQSGAFMIDMDIENNSHMSWKVIKKEAEKQNTNTIASYHNLKKTPGKKELKSILENLLQYETNYVKIACSCKNEEDMFRLLSISKLDSGIVAVGMGNYGALSRILAPFFNIPFTYASSRRDRNLAPGQLFYKKLEKKWQEIL